MGGVLESEMQARERMERNES